MTAEELRISARCWIEIDLDALVENYHQARALLGGKAQLFCVLKSNAYGHGLLRTAQTLEAAGATHFAVAAMREALYLRKNGIRGKVLCMGPSEAALCAAAVENEVMMTVASLADARAISAVAARLGKAARIHLKIDTGMHRLGFACDEASVEDIVRVAALPALQMEGMYSHLQLISAQGDAAQNSRLLFMRDALASRGVEVGMLHLCDSIGMVRYPHWHYGACRVGAMLYGVRPARSEDMAFSCRETVALKTRVLQLHDIPAGEYIGYDESARTTRPTRIATLGAGYGDGYPRAMGNRAYVSIRGQRCPVVGVVCMDLMMADVTEAKEIEVGDVVTLLGGEIPYMQYARWMDSNRNEALVRLSERPIRLYLRGGRAIGADDALWEGRIDDE